MLAALLLLVQANGGTPERIDLLAAAQDRCPQDGDDIVVCGRRRDDRLIPVAPPPADHRPAPDGPLSFRLPGGGTAKTEAVHTATGGFTGNGVAARLKLPF